VKLQPGQIPGLIDVSALKADTTERDVRELVDAALTRRFIAVFALPCWVPLVRKLISGPAGVSIGGVVGFPTGAELTSVKAAQTEKLLELGCNEIDMVINIGMLKSGTDDAAAEDIAAVIKAASGLPVKVILEGAYLTEEEIRRGCRIVADSGAAYVKTGTGWASAATTLEHIRIMKSCVGDEIKIKAAGGIKDLETVHAMYEAGVSRFGIGLKSALAILEEAGA
jgi:deoxyribose-phosphate aldolase